MFVTTDEHTLKPDNHPKLTLGTSIGVVNSMGSDKCIMACIGHYSIIQGSFTALRTFCAPPVYPSQPLNPWQ